MKDKDQRKPLTELTGTVIIYSVPVSGIVWLFTGWVNGIGALATMLALAFLLATIALIYEDNIFGNRR